MHVHIAKINAKFVNFKRNPVENVVNYNDLDVVTFSTHVRKTKLHPLLNGLAKEILQYRIIWQY